jgi:tetratricopeptide (TPR) repeat protein
MTIFPFHDIGSCIDSIWYFYDSKGEYGKLHKLMESILSSLEDMKDDPPEKVDVPARIASIQLHLAEITEESGNLPEAIAEYTEAIAVASESHASTGYIAFMKGKRTRALLGDGQYSKAVEDLKSALEEDERDWQLNKNLGIAFKGLGKKEEAILYLRKAAECYEEAAMFLFHPDLKVGLKEIKRHLAEIEGRTIDTNTGGGSSTKRGFVRR